MIGRLIEPTNNGTPYIGSCVMAFDHADVARWGLFVAYGNRNRYLAVELRDGRQAGVLEGIQDTEDRKWLRKKKRTIRTDALAAAGIRAARVAGIVWEQPQ